MERIGRYEIIEELGRGAMGVVYRARDPRIGREVAIKTIRFADHADASEAQTLKERLFREAQSAGRLSHPSIVTIYDIDEDGGVAYITMELVEGQTLENRLRSGEPLPLEQVSDILMQVAEGLDYAHGKEIVHRDVKPANIMLTPSGRVKVMDFGIARISSSHLTQTGTVMGTPSYMSPEQVRGDEVTGRADQFSLAVITYEILSGNKPFAGENLTSVIFKIVSSEPAALVELNPHISPELEAVVMRALAKSPEDRHETCVAFAEAFAQAQEDLASAAGAAAAAPEKPAREVDMTAPAMGAERTADEDSREDRPAAIKETAIVGKAAAEAPSEPAPPQRARPEAAPEAPPLPPPHARQRGEALQPGRDRRSFREEGGEKEHSNLVYVAAALMLTLGAAVAFVALTDPSAFHDPAAYLRPLVGLAPAPAARNAAGSEGISRDAPPSALPVPPEPGATGAQQRFEEITGSQPAASAEDAEDDAAASAPEAQPEPAQAKAAAPARTPAAPRAPAPPVEVAFRATPDGALVVVDENQELTCSTPCSLELSQGHHTAVFSKPEHRTVRRSFEVGRQAATIEANLPSRQGTVLVSSTPLGADVYVNGEKVAGQTNTRLNLSPGYHMIRVQKAGAGEAEVSVKVNEGELLPLRFRLSGSAMLKGSLKLESAPRGATVTLNGRTRAAVTPATVETAPGTYQVAFRLAGHETVVREVEVEADKTTGVSVNLPPAN